MESIITAYIGCELVSNPGLLQQKNEVQPRESVLRFVLSVEQQFGLTQGPEELVSEHFETIDTLCANLWAQPQMQGVQG